LEIGLHAWPDKRGSILRPFFSQLGSAGHNAGMEVVGVKANPYKAYEQTSVTTATPGELTLMLYNGCLKFIRFGKAAISENDMEAKNTNLQKAQRIIHELMVTLNMDVPIAKDMLRMYDYIHRRLIEANVKSDLEILNEVEELVTGFRDTWKQVLQITKQQTRRQAGQA
jgi:flagellar protein FliS